jgi:cholesterol oxidase
MASVDHDVVIIGSGFGGSVAALRAAEKGYRVGRNRAARGLQIVAVARS